MFTFDQPALDRIAAVLGVPAKMSGALARFHLNDEETGRRITLEIHTALPMPDGIQEKPANLVSVASATSFLQLQSCTGYIASEELGEVIFFAKTAGVTNGLVVERQAGASLYANVDDRMLKADFTQLAPELMMSTVALSMTESLFNDMQ
ncbi:MAG: hypothetical protein AAF752_08100 [Bacteroidota bacterium]